MRKLNTEFTSQLEELKSKNEELKLKNEELSSNHAGLVKKMPRLLVSWMA